jgi:uncharacterized membrane protein HdeD (DUF308 family)
MADGLPAYPSDPDLDGPTGPVPRSGIAIAALVLGVLSIPLAFTIYLGLLVGLLAVVLGVTGLVTTRGGRRSGRGMATAGLITGLVGLVFAAALGLYGLRTYRDCESRLGHRPTRAELRECARAG